jgi:hypothetical protein
VQADPIKLILKPPGNEHLKLTYDEQPSNFAFTFNLHRYTTGSGILAWRLESTGPEEELRQCREKKTGLLENSPMHPEDEEAFTVRLVCADQPFAFRHRCAVGPAR